MHAAGQTVSAGQLPFPHLTRPIRASTLQREARAAEQQRVQEQDELALLQDLEEEEGQGEEEGPASQDQAMRELVQKLRQWPPGEQAQQLAAEAAPASAAAASRLLDAEPVEEAAGDGSQEEDSPELPPIDVVEADYIVEEQSAGRPAPQGMPPPAPSRCVCRSRLAGPWFVLVATGAGCVRQAAGCSSMLQLSMQTDVDLHTIAVPSFASATR